MTKADDVLKRLEDAAREATPKWKAYERERGRIQHEWKIRTPTDGTMFRSTSYGNMNADATFIGMANPTTILALLDDRKALLEALQNANEHTACVLEDMQHYFENQCIPTADEVNQCAICDSEIRVAIAASEARIAKLGDGECSS